MKQLSFILVIFPGRRDIGDLSPCRITAWDLYQSGEIRDISFVKGSLNIGRIAISHCSSEPKTFTFVVKREISIKVFVEDSEFEF